MEEFKLKVNTHTVIRDTQVIDLHMFYLHNINETLSQSSFHFYSCPNFKDAVCNFWNIWILETSLVNVCYCRQLMEENYLMSLVLILSYHVTITWSSYSVFFKYVKSFFKSPFCDYFCAPAVSLPAAPTDAPLTGSEVSLGNPAFSPIGTPTDAVTQQHIPVQQNLKGPQMPQSWTGIKTPKDLEKHLVWLTVLY